jgi:sugar (pentulose or hexulose) kinase
MPLLLGVDIGTTTITGLALDTESGGLAAVHTTANDGDTTSAADKTRGRSEWDATRMVQRASECLRAVTEQLGSRRGDCVGIGITGQQHGVVLVDGERKPLTPFFNWQDRRGLDPCPGTQGSFVDQAVALVGKEASQRTGCRLATGYLGTTLFWMDVQGRLPRGATACFLGDYLAAQLTGERPVTDPTHGASSGLFDVPRRAWAKDLIDALKLPAGLFPEVREAGQSLGGLSKAAADPLGLSAGVPVFVAIGDNQAAFVGSVADRQRSVLVNVGTGAQVAAYAEQFVYAPPLETRPFPIQGNLLVNAGLCGGRSYALLERFFQNVSETVLGTRLHESLYEAMNRLAEAAPAGADGLRCVPLFTGTRANPELRGEWTGISPENFTPGHLVRALLEGMARVFHDGFELICQATGVKYLQLVGSGNGLRENSSLSQIVAKEFALPLGFPPIREEAALGAAMIAGVGAGVFADLTAAGKVVESRE